MAAVLQSDSSKELFKGAETFAIVSGKATDDEAMYTKTASLHEWLFGVVMSDSVVVFCDKDIHFLLSSKKGQPPPCTRIISKIRDHSTTTLILPPTSPSRHHP